MTPTRRNLWLGCGVLAGALAFAICIRAGLGAPAAWTAAVTLVCAVWWVTEPVSVPVTSLLPFVVLPMVGVISHKDAAEAYGNTLILLLLGGFLLSAGMERSGAHRRIALGLVRGIGGGGRRLVLGMMVACALCSMWISNTATTLMLLPVVTAILRHAPDRTLTQPLLLGVAYSASIGGMGTPVGTPPNVIFMGIYQEIEGGRAVSFLDWMAIGVPIVLVFVPLAWWWLVRNVPRSATPVQLPPVGPRTTRETRVLAIFALAALAWVFRSQPWGGWQEWTGLTGANDATVALAAATALFVLPSGEHEHDRLLDWTDAKALPWGLLLLFGGGIAIAKAFGTSGLAAALGDVLAHDLGLGDWPVPLTVLAICLAVTFLTEVTSNTATTTLLMPVLASAGQASGVDPALWMVPAALSASCAFMLPVATAPNAVVYGTGDLRVSDMAREGFALNLIGAIVIAGWCTLCLAS